MNHWQALCFVSLVAALHTPRAASAQVPARIPYQGRGTTVASSVQQYPSSSSVTTQHLQALQTLGVGSHTLKVRWRTDKGSLGLSWENATRSILAFE